MPISYLYFSSFINLNDVRLMRIKITLLFFLLCTSLFVNSCGSAKAQAPVAPTGLALLNGKYTYWSTGQLWSGGQDGSSALPSSTIFGYMPKVLFDSGTFDADGKGNASQCGAGAWGTWTTPINCVTIWKYEFGTNESGQPTNPRLGLIESNQGDKGTLACTETGKHCVMTSHGVGWSWTQVLDRE
jgi:hypothetical protein